MRTSLTNKLIAGAVATLTVLAVQRFALMPAAFAAGHDTQAPTASREGSPGDPAAGAEAKTSRYPIRGKLKAVDTAASTFTLSGSDKDRVFKTTTQTEIIRQGKAATLAEAVVGEEVGGLVERQSDGSVVALKVRFGPKTEDEKKATTTPKRKPRSSTAKTADVR
jgi:hypothetical protein